VGFTLSRAQLLALLCYLVPRLVTFPGPVLANRAGWFLRRARAVFDLFTDLLVMGGACPLSARLLASIGSGVFGALVAVPSVRTFSGRCSTLGRGSQPALSPPVFGFTVMRFTADLRKRPCAHSKPCL
jgi:hypothetical protein